MSILKSKYLSYLQLFKQDKLGFALKSIVYFLGFVLLLTLPIFTFRTTFNNVTNILAILFCLAAFAYLIIRGSFVFDWFIVPLLLYVVYCTLSFAFTGYSFSTLRSIYTLYGLLFFIYEFCVLEKAAKKFLLFFIFGTTLLAAFILVENFNDIVSLDFGRLGGNFGNENGIGMGFALATFLCVQFGLKERKLCRFVFFFCAFVFFVFTFLTGSRGALVFAFLSTLISVYFFLKGKKRIWFILFLLFAVVLVLIVLQMPVFSTLKDRFFDAFVSLISGGNSDDFSANSRLTMIETGLMQWFESPIFGHGLDSFAQTSDFYVYAHASIADMLCNLGIVGFGLWIAPLIYCFFKLSHQEKSLVFGFAFGITLPGLFLSILSSGKFYMIVYCLILAVVRTSRDLTPCITFNFSKKRFNLSLVRSSRSIFDFKRMPK